MWVNGFQTLLPDRKECLLRNWQAIVLSQSHFGDGDSPFCNHSSSSRLKATDHAHRPLEIPNVSLSVLKFRSNPAFPAQEPKSGQEKKDDWRPRSKKMLGGRPRPKMRMKIQLWPWLPVITGYFYGIIHSINGILLVLITYNWSMAITVGVGKGGASIPGDADHRASPKRYRTVNCECSECWAGVMSFFLSRHCQKFRIFGRNELIENPSSSRWVSNAVQLGSWRFASRLAGLPPVIIHWLDGIFHRIIHEINHGKSSINY